MSGRVYSVGQVNAYIRSMFEQDYALRRISVEGEVSNLTYHRSGHIYFTLKDEAGALSCVMFAGDRSRGLGFRMKDGDRVVVTGPIEVYVRDGRYQLYAKTIEQQGAGVLYEKFLALKKELEEMGMFDPSYKQPIPAYVRRLGVVTAPTGAAVRDIQNIATRRNPYIQLILYPALVQGEGAAASIVAGIRALDAMGLDCIIVGRGGGSIEDLWAFNEEAVARAIFDCGTPIISAVGHETDTTIADFVADLRAPTPSAAAELAVCDVREMLRRMEHTRDRLQKAMRARLDASRAAFAAREAQLRHLSPAHQIREKRMRLEELGEKLRAREAQRIAENKAAWNATYRELLLTMPRRVEQNRQRLELLLAQLDALSPIRKLSQGYAYAENAAGQNIASIAQVQAGDALFVQVQDGVISGTVTGAEPLSRPGLSETEHDKHTPHGGKGATDGRGKADRGAHAGGVLSAAR